ncbi:hypothetical protein [Micromonospora tarensis]|uniref:Uncharacterized protein n=1 Tax=Micromonospora tarensis TaxID=2806100 RepID=A0ABS1YD53_9ACTN|nr:hypothetical protein [Micromonospora tarensis]MBM0275348.1 hypothetical protein [Micromonospora tarensis]
MATTTIPEQPDGIEDDSYDLPHPARAAERVREYISAFGDGLYDVQDGQPLYGRDLEAIARTARGAVKLWRCTKCGKWSHAKRKPKQHQRFVATGRTVVGWAGEPVYGPDGEFQACGPFAEWVAAPTRGPLSVPEPTPAPLTTVPSRPHRDEPALHRPITTVHLPAANVPA